jgi:serine protease Do
MPVHLVAVERERDEALLPFDAATLEGMGGGALVSAYDGRIIGIVGGRFDSEEAGPDVTRKSSGAEQSLSYAVSSEYLVEMLTAYDGRVI